MSSPASHTVRCSPKGSSIDRVPAAVVIVRVTLALLLPELVVPIAMDEGENWQVAPVGSPAVQAICKVLAGTVPEVVMETAVLVL